MKYPKMSIIVPVFNEENIIEKALKHMTEEIKYPNFEILLGIDGEDNSINIARRYAKKFKNIKISYSKKRRGIFAAENAMIKMASGEILIKLDCDARFVEPEKALYNIAKHYKNPKIGALFFDCQYVPDEEKKRSLTVRGESFVMKLVTHYMESIGSIKGKWNCFMVVCSIRKNITDKLKLDSIIDDIQFAYSTLDKGYEIKFSPDVKYYKIGNPPNPKILFNQKKRNYKYWLRAKEVNKEIRLYLFYWIVFKYFLKNIYKYKMSEIIPFFYWCTVFAWSIAITNLNVTFDRLFKKQNRNIEWQSIRRVDKK